MKMSEMFPVSSKTSQSEITDPVDIRRFMLCCNDGLLKEIWSHQSADFRVSLSLKVRGFEMS